MTEPPHLSHALGCTCEADALKLATELARYVQAQIDQFAAITPWAVCAATSAVATLAQAELDSQEEVGSAHRHGHVIADRLREVMTEVRA